MSRADAVPPGQLVVPGKSGGLGTFGGVFTPTLVTILGVIMYLREGWVIGNAGLLGGVMVMLLAFGITGLTGLAMSSITTNIRIGAWGAYPIVAQSLGLEIGGALGIPRYLSHALAVTMYVFGFREGWIWIFPEHPTLLVDAAAFGLLFLIAWVSLDLAIKIQYLILVVIIGSLISVAVAAFQGSMVIPFEDVQLWGSFPGDPEDGFQGTSFWVVFAVFFPASTGIMAGANLSADLKNPKKSIPRGTMAAMAVSLGIYLALAYWLARSATPEELTSNYTVMMDKAAWGPAVLAGLLGATFSSALASLVGSARILQAMGEHRVIPKGPWLGGLTERGEPRHALAVTGGLILLSLLFRDLNAIAPLITMFCLITYAMINAVVFMEQTMGLVSFRPLLKLPRWVSLMGLLGSLFAMGMVNPALGLISVAVVVGFYVILLRSHLTAPFGDMRSGLFQSVAEWAAKKVADLPDAEARAWTPNLLVPVEDPRTVKGAFLMLHDISYPQGSVTLMGLSTPLADRNLGSGVYNLSNAFRNRGVFASWCVLDASEMASGVIAGMQSLRNAFFRPNIVFLDLTPEEDREGEFTRIGEEATEEEVGVLVHVPHPRTGVGVRRSINVWIRDRSPDWSISMNMGNLDLPLLVGYKLLRNWEATSMQLITVVESRENVEEARQFLEDVVTLGRIPRTRVMAVTEPIETYLPQAPSADISIFGLSGGMDFAFMRKMVEDTRSTCLFVQDSGRESVLA